MPVRNNVTRMLDARRIPYTPVEYDPARFHSAEEVAQLIGAPPAQVFKTIVVLREERGRRPLLVILPGNREINLRRLAAEGAQLGVYPDAPEELARVALAHLGAARRVELLETGAGARERLLRRFGNPQVEVADTRDALVRISARGAAQAPR